MSHSVQSELSSTALEFHGSEVSSVVSVNSDIHVVFSAAHVQRSISTPGIDASDGYEQAVELQLRQAVWTGSLNECIGNLSEGELSVDQTSVKRVPLPFQAVGNVALNLHFSNGAVLSAWGTSVKLSQRAQTPFVENFAC
ncbi:MAG: hypothetical protein WCG50_16195 [Rhodoferax sp.]|uniref:hypothetical protein n=1 Tax=Rhodoferax sp. TaxID=50421 RepID=UPI003019410B